MGPSKQIRMRTQSAYRRGKSSPGDEIEKLISAVGGLAKTTAHSS
jgi:hypothetical protein